MVPRVRVSHSPQLCPHRSRPSQTTSLSKQMLSLILGYGGGVQSSQSRGPRVPYPWDPIPILALPASGC